MNKTLFKKQIPTFVGLIILFVGAGAGVFLVGNEVDFLPRAAPEFTPKRLQITNVSDNSFTVSWVTDEPTTGFVRYGTTSDTTTTTIADDRDQVSGSTGDFRVHHVSVRGLNSSSQYYFEIGSGGSELYDDNGSPYQVTTAPPLAAPSESESIYGKVVTQADSPAENAVVYIKMDGAAPISTLVKASSSWAALLSTLRTTNLSQYLVYDPDTSIINIEVIGFDGVPTSGKTNTSNDQPVPTITLGKDFDFTGTLTTTVESADPDVKKESGFEVSGEDLDGPTATTVDLLNPSIDGEELNSSRPEIQGQAPPNIEINITVNSETEYVDTFTVEPDGFFSWTPPGDLEPGDHSVTISWIDPESGIEQLLTRNFVVLAQGQSSLPALESTPSASPTPTATPVGGTTQTPTPTPRPTPTPTPVPTPSPTPTPTLVATRSSQPVTDGGVPEAGSVSQTLMMLLAGAGLIGSGLFISKRFE